MRFQPVPTHYFKDFHTNFRGDTQETFRICQECGGACEWSKIGTLMPGEREYMAEAAGLPVAEFSRRYLDTLIMPEGWELDVLRLVNGCPFLDAQTYECTCRAFKVVLCEIYPLGFQVKDEEVTFEVDDWCPLSELRPLRRHFEVTAAQAVARIPVEVEWYRQVALYDDLNFDYLALEACRTDRASPRTFTFEELLRCQRDGSERPPGRGLVALGPPARG